MDVVLSQTEIASERINVKRIIAQITKFKVLIPLKLNGTINQICPVACLLCNFVNGRLSSSFNTNQPWIMCSILDTDDSPFFVVLNRKILFDVRSSPINLCLM